MSDLTIGILVLIVMAIGLAGTLVPIVPGMFLIWGAALVYGLVTGFTTAGVIAMVVITLLLAISLVTTLSIPRRSAQDAGVSASAQVLALVGGVIGFFVIPIVGLFVGALIGLVVAEFVNHQDLGKAIESTKSVAKGMGKSMIVDFALGLSMIGVWAFWAIAT